MGGTGTFNLIFGGNVTGTDGGIHLVTASGDNHVTISSTGTVNGGSGAGSNPAISLSSTSGNVTVDTAAGSNIFASGAGRSGIVATTGGAGNVLVNALGAIGNGS